MIDKEIKQFCFKADSVTETSVNGVRVGKISGYASTYGNIDRVGDVVEYGAFRKTIEDFRASGRPIRMYYQHDDKEIIGAFMPYSLREDEKGLYVEGELNLEVQRAREIYALAKQGVISDLSIGYSIDDFELRDGVRYLKDLTLWEISMVNEPANPKAKITQVKSITELKDEIKTKRDLEEVLRDAGFSRSSAKFITSLVDSKKLNEDENVEVENTAELREEVVTESEQAPAVEQAEEMLEPSIIEEAKASEAEVAEVKEDMPEEDDEDDADMLELLTALQELIKRLSKDI